MAGVRWEQLSRHNAFRPLPSSTHSCYLSFSAIQSDEYLKGKVAGLFNFM